MGQTIGFYLAAIYPVAAILCSILVLLRRDHYFIRCRNPLLLMIQNAASVVSCELMVLYIALRPEYNCGLWFAAVNFMFSLYGIPLLVRCWEYCVNFKMSLMRLQYRSSFHLDWEQSSWFFKHRWVGQPLYLKKILVVLMILLSLPNFIALDSSQLYYDETSHGCTIVSNAFYVGVTVAIIFVVVSIAIGLLIFRARDVFHIKREINIIALVWSFAVVFFLGYSSRARPEQQNFPAAFVLVACFFISLFACNILPLIYAYRYDRKSKTMIDGGSLAYFTSLLESVQFRNAFHDFLTKQFCQENLQFYEVVNLWKEIRTTDPERRRRANSIVNVFINESGLCQVNVIDSERAKIMEKMKMEEIPADIFDAALAALIEDMHTNSFRQYRNNSDSYSFDGTSSTMSASIEAV